MAVLSITAASVFPGSGAKKETGIALAAITAGQVLYKEASSGKLGLCDMNSATAEVRVPIGIALHSAAANQSITYQTKGHIVIGATVPIGESYYASDTAGGIMPEADLSSGEYVAFLGIAVTTTTIDLDIKVSGVAVP